MVVCHSFCSVGTGLMVRYVLVVKWWRRVRVEVLMSVLAEDGEAGMEVGSWS